MLTKVQEISKYLWALGREGKQFKIANNFYTLGINVDMYIAHHRA